MRFALVPALIVALGLSGCAHSNYFRTGKDDKPAPYTNLQCSEPGNNEGFSFEVPGCFCNGGIRMRYRANRQDDGRMSFGFELESGYKNEKVDYTRIIADQNLKIRQVIVSGRQLPPYRECNDAEKMQWDSARESFKIWERYDPVLDELFRTCVEERIDR